MTILDTRTALADNRSKKELWIGEKDGFPAAFFHPTMPQCFVLRRGQVEEHLFELQYQKGFKLSKR